MNACKKCFRNINIFTYFKTMRMWAIYNDSIDMSVILN